MTTTQQYANAAMAIDLGAEFIKMALIKPGVPMEIVLNRESQRKTPFALTIKQGERFFASEALKKGVAATRNTYTFFLDIVGKPFSHPTVKQYQERFPHLQLNKNEHRGTVNFVTDAGEIPVETMLAMVLTNARSEVEAYAGQPVKDAVISTPVNFGQSEFNAVEAAAKIAGLNLFHFLSSGASAALNYGVFRYKDITEQPQILMIYDVGSTKIQATVVQYMLSTANDSATPIPKLEIIGYGVDPQLGGHHLTLKLRQRLVEAFRLQHPKADGDVTNSPQAMAKLLREADRVKQVLSANLETFAQVECLYQDLDFRAKITRQELEDMFVEFEGRILIPVEKALQMAGLGVGKLDRILLMGAGTRVPRLQELLGEFFDGKELSRNLNTDEAIALGAVYQAARKNFIVKRFDVEDIKPSEGEVQGVCPMNDKEIAEAKSLLFQFESREKAKLERDAALNSLESAVFDYSARMEEKEFTNYGTPEEVEQIVRNLGVLKEWLEDMPEETTAEQFKEKRRELVKPIRKLKNRKQQKEERPQFIEKMLKALQEADKQLQEFKKAPAEALTEAEVEQFGQLLFGTKGWFESVLRQFDGLNDNQDPPCTNDDLKVKANTLNRELKLLSNKVKTFMASKPKSEGPNKEDSKGMDQQNGNGGKTDGNMELEGGEGTGETAVKGQPQQTIPKQPGAGGMGSNGAGENGMTSMETD